MPAAFLNISPQGLSLTGSSLIQLDWTATEPQWFPLQYWDDRYIRLHATFIKYVSRIQTQAGT